MLTALRVDSDGLAAAPAALAFELPRSTQAAGKTGNVSTARLWIDVTLPAAAVRPCATGAKTNWPNDPPELTLPVARPRPGGLDQARGRRHQHRRAGHAGAASGEHAGRRRSRG